MLNPWAPDQLKLAKTGLVGVTFSIHPFMISEWHTKNCTTLYSKLCYKYLNMTQ